MTGTEFIIELLDKVAWPLVVLTLAVIFRNSITNLLTRLRALTTKYGSLSFDQGVVKAKSEAEQAGLGLEIEEAEKEDLEYFKELVLISPRAVILESWLKVEGALGEFLRKQGQGRHLAKLRSQSQKALQMLEMSEAEVSLFNELRSLRNEVVHRDDIFVGGNAGVEYARLALKLANSIKNRSG